MTSNVIEQYRGRYVAIDDDGDGDVVADAAELDELIAILDTMGVHGVLLRRIPEADQGVIIGLG